MQAGGDPPAELSRVAWEGQTEAVDWERADWERARPGRLPRTGEAATARPALTLPCSVDATPALEVGSSRTPSEAAGSHR